MLQRHNLLAGSPNINYLTLPTVLKDEDYDRFLGALAEFLVTYKQPLALLAAETAPGTDASAEEIRIREAMTTTTQR